MRAVLVISPHLDDGVLSAGQFMAGRPDVVAATVFTGTPPTKTVATSYDLACGFQSAQEAVSRRRQEDIEALSVLGATHRHLNFIDSQYGFGLDHHELVKQLKALIEELDPEFVISCMGLVHPDHEAVREATLEAMRYLDVPLWLYEDLPMRVLQPESVRDALDNITEWGLELELGFCGTGLEATKLNAIWCYRSQLGLPEFENRHALLVPERFWLVKVVAPEAEK